MASITLKNIPDELYERLKRSARRHHRSINGEIIHRLEQALAPREVPVEERLARLRELRKNLPRALEPEEMRRAMDAGRP